jgi:hypothetical protein
MPNTPPRAWVPKRHPSDETQSAAMFVRLSQRRRRFSPHQRSKATEADWPVRLASAVILEALDDIEHGGEWAKADAAQFFASDGDLGFWCAVAGISTESVRTRAAHVAETSTARMTA